MDAAPPVEDVRGVIDDVFISHASPDKPFVRRLDGRLREEGFSTWLDERKLLPGDSLARTLGEAIESAKVVVVVISEHSSRSRWLKYELNMATERMVKGDCRLIPIMIGGADAPPEIKGLVYADFRKTFEHGFEAVRRALDEEVSKHSFTTFDGEIERLLGVVFDRTGRLTVSRDDDTEEWNVAEVDGLASREEGEEAWIGYEILAKDWTFGEAERRDTLSEGWRLDFLEAVEHFCGDYFVVISERTIGFKEKEPYYKDPRIFFDAGGYPCPILIVDFSEVEDEEDRLKTLKEVRAYMLRDARGDFGPSD